MQLPGKSVRDGYKYACPCCELGLNRTTMARWIIKSGQLVQPLTNLIQDKLLEYDILQMDETRVQVLKEDGRTAQSQFLDVGVALRAARPTTDSFYRGK